MKAVIFDMDGVLINPTARAEYGAEAPYKR